MSFSEGKNSEDVNKTKQISCLSKSGRQYMRSLLTRISRKVERIILMWG